MSVNCHKCQFNLTNYLIRKLWPKSDTVAKKIELPLVGNSIFIDFGHQVREIILFVLGEDAGNHIGGQTAVDLFANHSCCRVQNQL